MTIIKHFSLRAIAPIAISITASALDSIFWLAPLFCLIFDPPELISSLPFLIGCGIMFGLVAVFFMVSVRFFVSVGKKSGLHNDPNLCRGAGVRLCGHGFPPNPWSGDGNHK